MNRKRVLAELALAGVTVIWGTTFVVVKAALTEVSPLIFLSLRFCVAALTMLLIYRRAIRWKAIGPGLVAGGLLFAAFVFQTLGLQLTTPSKSAFLTGLSIPMVPLVSSVVYRVRPRRVEIAGILIASAGMMLMTVSPAADLRAGITQGDFLSVLCAVTFAFHIVFIGHHSRRGGFESLAVTQIATAALLASAVFWFAGPARFHLTKGVAVAVLVTGLLATALAFTAQAWAQQYTSSTRAALIFTLEAPVAWLTSFVSTGERMLNPGKVGAGMILAGILVVELTRGKFETIDYGGSS